MEAKVFLQSQSGPIIGSVIQMMARTAIDVIRRHRTEYTANKKRGYSGEMDDVCTSADLEAQERYVRMIRNLFPYYGLIAEEAGMRIACDPGMDEEIYFTVDPLDGTKAFIRSQSYGIGTMIALVRSNIVIAVCIGNVMTQELFCCIPGETEAWRVDSEAKKQQLKPNFEKPLSQQYGLIRDRPEAHSTLVQRMLDLPSRGGLFKNFQTADGSIGLSMARLWNGEVGMAIQPATTATPWDGTPVIGINQRLDILQLQQDDDGYFLPRPYVIPRDLTHQPETIYLHRAHLEEFVRWQEKTFERFR